MESSPLRVIPLLSINSPCRGILFYRYRERAKRRLVLEAVLEESRIVALALMMLTCIRIRVFKYMLYKSKTFELLELLDIVGMYLWVM